MKIQGNNNLHMYMYRSIERVRNIISIEKILI